MHLDGDLQRMLFNAKTKILAQGSGHGLTLRYAVRPDQHLPRAIPHGLHKWNFSFVIGPISILYLAQFDTKALDRHRR
jgi:hypothetical protein